MKKIELSEHFTWGKLLRYSLPAIGQMLAITSFQLVDGVFVSNYLGVTPFAAVNFISPAFLVLYGLGFMFGSGTSALVAQLMGEGERQKGREVFTLSMAAMVLLGAVLGALATALMPALARLVRATEAAIPYCVDYGRLLTAFLPAYLVNAAFQSLWITAEKPVLGMWVSVVNGALNVLLDWLFMGPLGWGVRGAALATSLSALITAGFTAVYYLRPNASSLRLVRVNLAHLRELGRICGNGFSEMVDGLTANLTQLVINGQLTRYIGEIGVAAMGVYNYVIELFMAVFFGISSTMVTVVGYQYGAKNRKELDSLTRTGSLLSVGLGVAMCLLCAAFAGPIAGVYLGYDDAARGLAMQALRISSMACLFYGFNLVVSSVFTGLGDGLASALIAVCESLAAPVAMVCLVPALFGANAIWYATPLASLITAILCAAMLKWRYPRSADVSRA